MLSAAMLRTNPLHSELSNSPRYSSCKRIALLLQLPKLAPWMQAQMPNYLPILIENNRKISLGEELTKVVDSLTKPLTMPHSQKALSMLPSSLGSVTLSLSEPKLEASGTSGTEHSTHPHPDEQHHNKATTYIQHHSTSFVTWETCTAGMRAPPAKRFKTLHTQETSWIFHPALHLAMHELANLVPLISPGSDPLLHSVPSLSFDALDVIQNFLRHLT